MKNQAIKKMVQCLHQTMLSMARNLSQNLILKSQCCGRLVQNLLVVPSNKFPQLREENIELETANRNKIELLNGDGSRKRLTIKSKNEGKSLGSSSNIVEVKGKEGPWFWDMGDMKAVLDELIMDVTVPLYHSDIPSLLGVKLCDVARNYFMLFTTRLSN